MFISSHRQSCADAHFNTPTERRPNPKVFAPPSVDANSDTTELQMAKTVSRKRFVLAPMCSRTCNQTTKHVCLQLQDDRGLESLSFPIWGSRDDPEETTEAHGAQVPLRSPESVLHRRLPLGEDPGEVRQPHHVSSHSPFPEMFELVRQPHHVACTVVNKNAAHLKATKCRWR